MFYLRELERKDLEKINKWRNDPELIDFLGAPFRYINLDVDIKWYESYMSNRGNAVRCAITSDDRDDILGLVSLVSVNYMNQSAEFHIMIGHKENQGKGIGTFAVREMLNHAFNNMNLQRVELTVLEDNKRAKNLYEKCGFVYEGRKRKAKYKNGKFVDMLMYSILKPEFLGGGDSTQLNNANLLPKWCTAIASNQYEVDSVISSCDDAFREPVAKRIIYPDLLDKIYSKGICFYVYQQENIGYCAFYANDLEGKNAYISLIAVKPQYQKLHIGTDILRKSFEIMRAYNMENCLLEVKKDNLKAFRFYKSNGFQMVDEREQSYLMKCKL